MLTKTQYVQRHSALKHTGISKINRVALAKASEILDALKKSRNKTLTHVWGYDPNSANGEHHSGRAFDFMVFNDRAAGDFIADYVIKHKERLGLIHVIWRQRIYRGPKSTSKNPKGVWQKMSDRGNSTQNHMDHPHVWFASSSTYVGPTVQTGVPRLTTPLSRSSKGGEVSTLQTMLNALQRANLTVDGSFGPATERAVAKASKAWNITDNPTVVGPKFRAQANKRYAELIEKLANDVIAGVWGNQPQRERALKNSGYDYQTVQNRVRELLNS